MKIFSKAFFNKRYVKGSNVALICDANRRSMNKNEGFPVGSWVKNPPAMQETQAMKLQSLGQDDPLE